MRTKANLNESCRAFIRLSIVGLLTAALGAQDGAVAARDAWVRAVPPSKTETALYVVLENHSPQRREVVSGSSEAAEKVELHEMKLNRTVMTMTPAARVAIPGKGKTAFEPNGLHIMLFGLKTKPAVGDTVTVTLKLDDGTAVPVAATVRK